MTIICCTVPTLSTVTPRAAESAAGAWAAIAVASELEAAALDVRMVASTLIDPAEMRRVMSDALTPPSCAARFVLNESCRGMLNEAIVSSMV